MLSFMGENNRLLNIHEQKFAELAAFQANITVFQANTNASLKILETQVGKLALSIQNQSRDSFPSDTKKNPKDCMAITLRSGKELKKREKEERKLTEKEKQAETGKSKMNSLEITVESEKSEVQKEQQTEERKLQKKKEEEPTSLLFLSLRECRSLRWMSSLLNS